jgi:hypothetical protein
MRKVSKKIAAAFMQHKAAKSGTTETDGTTLWLHGNAVAQWHNNNVFHVSFAGWPSVTTRERLNSLPAVRVHQHKHEQFITNPANGQDVEVKDLRAWFPIPERDWKADVWTLNQLGV